MSQVSSREVKVQGKKENLMRREDARKTHPRDGSLSVSNPSRALDTLSGYLEEQEEKQPGKQGNKYTGTRELTQRTGGRVAKHAYQITEKCKGKHNHSKSTAAEEITPL